MRFGETRTYGAKPGTVDSRIMFSWSFNIKSEGDRLQTPQRRVDAKEALTRIAQRIVGKDDQWEANPRLAGVPGTLPEWLPVVE